MSLGGDGMAQLRRRVGRGVVLLVAALCWSSPVALAQYTFDPANEDEQGEHIRYFGAVKDEEGSLVKDATIVITHKSSSFVFVTDNLGRFRGQLPLDAVAGKVAVKCFKAGFEPVRVSKRAGSSGKKRSVQLDCVLRRSA